MSCLYGLISMRFAFGLSLSALCSLVWSGSALDGLLFADDF